MDIVLKFLMNVEMLFWWMWFSANGYYTFDEIESDSNFFSTHHPGNLPSDFNDARLDVGAVAEAAAPDEGEPDVAHDLLEGEVPEVGLEALSGSPSHPVFVNDVSAKEWIIDRLGTKEKAFSKAIGRGNQSKKIEC